MKSVSRQPVEGGSHLLTIGTLAKACGVTVRTLRYYEEVGLIGPIKRSAGKYRLYNHRTLKRINAILALQDLNYSLEEILAMIGPGVNRSKADRVRTTRESLMLQRERVDGKLVSLRQVQDDLIRRLSVLERICTPCLDKNPGTDCHDACRYRDIHFD